MFTFPILFLKDHDDYQTAANLTKFNTHINSTSMTLSNSELNNICPHGKGSTKSEYKAIGLTLNMIHVSGVTFLIGAIDIRNLRQQVDG